jgi:hypothetical protein
MLCSELFHASVLQILESSSKDHLHLQYRHVRRPLVRDARNARRSLRALCIKIKSRAAHLLYRPNLSLTSSAIRAAHSIGYCITGPTPSTLFVRRWCMMTPRFPTSHFVIQLHSMQLTWRYDSACFFSKWTTWSSDSTNIDWVPLSSTWSTYWESVLCAWSSCATNASASEYWRKLRVAP